MMTKATLAWLGVAIVMIAAGSCFVDRKSDGLTCGAGGTCAGTRICENGYCVEQDCPGDCTACNEADKTCTVECTDSHHCGDVFCPSGWTCTITCSADNACGNITCASDASCSIDCQAGGACDQIKCSSACKCDVNCPAGNCGQNSCPQRGSTKCTSDGTGNGTCTSAPASCNAC